MTKGKESSRAWLAAIIAGLAFAAMPTAALAHHVITVTSTIQAAINAANPGDTIVVPPGTYHECPVVDESNITIKGSTSAKIDATGCENGLTVGTGAITTDPDSGLPVCPPITIQGFTIEGLTIKNADENGIFIIGANNFHVTLGKYVANHAYGIFPRCSTNGLIDLNLVDAAQVANDAGIYVGVDDHVLVTKNFVTGGPIGIEIENTINTVVRNNTATGNTSGILVVVLPGLPRASTDNVLIEQNVIANNNYPNPIPPTDPDDVALIPTGTGILNVGGDRVVIRSNVVTGNNSVGIALVDDPFAPFDPRIDPTVNLNKVVGNVVLQNGKSPDPDRALTPGADLVYLSMSTDNCFANNIFQTDFPAGIASALACP